MTMQEPDWSQYVPDIEPVGGGLDGGIELLKQLGIVDLYYQWIGKSDPRGSHRTESIMVSCPMPNHPDKTPSAWLNSEKHVWFCGACQVGGDIMDLAAIKFGIDYRAGQGSDFAELLELALESVGVDVEELKAQNADRQVEVVHERPPEKETPEEPDPDPEFQYEEVEDRPLLDWQSIVACYPDSFMAHWMEAVSPSRYPDEYLWWVGLQMVGLAIGRDCWLNAQMPVYPNLLLTFIGRTGLGKTSSAQLGYQVLMEALPFDDTNAASHGVKILETPGSGEALYDMFSWVPEGFTEPHGVRGALSVDELSELMTSSKRMGSTLREAVIGISDNKKKISHRSRAFGAITVAEPFLAIVAGGQPDAMSRIMDRNDNASGFANRFIFVSGTKKPRTPWFSTPSINLTGLAGKLQILHNWARSHAAGPEQGSIDLEDDAAIEFDELLKELDRIRERPMGDIYARLELHAMKILVILCVNAKTDLATKEMVQQVAHMIYSILPATTNVAEAISRTQDQWFQDQVIQKVERCANAGNHPPTRREIEGSFHSSKRDKTRISEAIHHLEKVGVLRKVRLPATKPGQRQADRWMLSD